MAQIQDHFWFELISLKYRKTGLVLVADTFQNGETCLHAAAVSGHLEIVRFLLRNPKVKDTISAKNRDGKTAYDLALEAGHDKVSEMIKYRATSSTTTKSNLIQNSSSDSDSARQTQRVRFAMNEAAKGYHSVISEMLWLSSVKS